MAEYRKVWIIRVRIDDGLSPEAKSVAEALSTAGVVGRLSSMDWQRVNRSLGRPTRDFSVRKHLAELQSAGYLGSWQDAYWHQLRGWRLTLPEQVLEETEDRNSLHDHR